MALNGNGFFAGLKKAQVYIGFIILAVGIVGGHIRGQAKQSADNLLLRNDIVHWQEQIALSTEARKDAMDTKLNALTLKMASDIASTRSYAEAIERMLIQTDANLSALVVSESSGNVEAGRLLAGRVAVLQRDMAAMQQGLRSQSNALSDSVRSIQASLSELHLLLLGVATATDSLTAALQDGPGLLRRTVGVIPGL